MNARVGVNNIRELADLKGKGSVLEGLLHGPATEETKVTAILGTATVAVGRGQITEGGSTFNDLVAVAEKDLDGLLNRALGDLGASGVTPRRRAVWEGRGETR